MHLLWILLSLHLGSPSSAAQGIDSSKDSTRQHPNRTTLYIHPLGFITVPITRVFSTSTSTIPTIGWLQIDDEQSLSSSISAIESIDLFFAGDSSSETAIDFDLFAGFRKYFNQSNPRNYFQGVFKDNITIASGPSKSQDILVNQFGLAVFAGRKYQDSRICLDVNAGVSFLTPKNMDSRLSKFNSTGAKLVLALPRYPIMPSLSFALGF